MACFLVPTAEAIVTTVTKGIVKKAETKAAGADNSGKIKFSEKLGWLNKMLWGGSGLLAFEHLWHGEITPFFPFLTAMFHAGDTAEMLHEMAVSGVGMALLVTAVWGGLVAVTGIIENRNAMNSDIKELRAE